MGVVAGWRIAVGCAGALVGALVLSSCSSAPAKTATRVPWVALAAVSAPTSTSTTTTTLAPAPACEARQLRAAPGQGVAGLGNVVSNVWITNVGATCRLSGYPDLVGATAARAFGPIAVRKNGTYFGNLTDANLSTGERGELLLGTSDGCSALNQPSQSAIRAAQRADTYHHVTIILPEARGSLGANVTFDVACGLDESQLGVAAPTPGQILAPPGSAQSLEATVHLPPSMNSGSTLRYVVSLHNPGATAVTWRTCPNYTETILTTPLAFVSQTFSRTYQLNCRAALDVGPGRTETFVMELAIGHVRRSSEAKFSWQLDTGDGPYAGQALRVFAAG